MTNKQNPRSPASETGAKGKTTQDDFRSETTVWKVPRWLYVAEDGTEIWSDREPRGPALRVYFLTDDAGRSIEQTTTANFKNWFGAFCTIKFVRPRGEGWELHDGRSDNFTVWRRPAREGER